MSFKAVLLVFGVGVLEKAAYYQGKGGNQESSQFFKLGQTLPIFCRASMSLVLPQVTSIVNVMKFLVYPLNMFVNVALGKLDRLYVVIVHVLDEDILLP